MGEDLQLETRQLIQVLCSDLWESSPWEEPWVGAERPPKTSWGAQLACWLWHPLHCLGSSGPGSGCWPAPLGGRHPLMQETLSSPAFLCSRSAPSFMVEHMVSILLCQLSLLCQCPGLSRGGDCCLPSGLGSLPVLEARDNSKAENTKFLPAPCGHWD